MTNASRRSLFRLFLGVLTLSLPLAAAANPDFAGQWVIDPEASSAIDPWSHILLDIEVADGAITMRETVSIGRRTHQQTYPLRIGEEVTVPVELWTGNRHIGAYIGGDGTKRMRAEWLDHERTLRVEANFMLATSQSETPVRTYTEYRLSRDGKKLVVLELRSSRNQPMLRVFKRS